MIFIIGALILAVSATAVTVKTLTGYVSLKPVYKYMVFVLVVWGWFSPALVGLFFKSRTIFSQISSGMVSVSFFLFGLAFLTFVFLMLRDFVWFSTYFVLRCFNKHNPKYHPKNPESYTLLNKTNVAMVCCAGVISFFSLYSGVRVPDVKTSILKTDKFSGDVRLVQLTDLHLNRFYNIRKLERIVEKTNALSADLIFLTGDIFDDKFRAIRKFLPVLQKLKAKNGVYMVWGNHEFYKGIARREQDLEKFGLRILRKNGLRAMGEKPVFVAGVSSPLVSEQRLSEIFKISGDEEYHILLAHFPIVFDKAVQQNIDLQLSGHTHGGQIFPFHFMAKRANKYLAGFYTRNKSTLYVSRGAGLWGPPMRFFAPSEITHIIVRGKEK